MFAYIKGALELKSNGYIVIDINGLGYKIFMSQNNIDTIGEWCVEYTKKVPNVLRYDYCPVECPDGFDFNQAMNIVKEEIDKLISVYECYYANVEHDIQSVMDNWLRDLKKRSNYV